MHVSVVGGKSICCLRQVFASALTSLLKMRFVFISAMAGVPWGGSEELWSRAALRLHQEGHEVSASVVWWPQFASEVARLAQQGVEVVTQTRPYERWPVMVWH